MPGKRSAESMYGVGGPRKGMTKSGNAIKSSRHSENATPLNGKGWMGEKISNGFSDAKAKCHPGTAPLGVDQDVCLLPGNSSQKPSRPDPAMTARTLPLPP